jgi:hypothetical protein
MLHWMAPAGEVLKHDHNFAILEAVPLAVALWWIASVLKGMNTLQGRPFEVALRPACKGRPRGSPYRTFNPFSRAGAID